MKIGAGVIYGPHQLESGFGALYTILMRRSPQNSLGIIQVDYAGLPFSIYPGFGGLYAGKGLLEQGSTAKGC